MRITGGKLLLVGLCLFFITIAVRADTIYLKNGKTYEGKVLSDSGGKVRFKTSSGMTLTFERSQVDRIEKGRTKLDEYKERLAALAKDDIPGHFDLADWCAENKLYSQKKKVLDRIRKICPDHPQLRRDRGHIWKAGKWAKAPKDLAPLTVTGGENQKVPEAGASVALPKGWKAELKAKLATALGPDRYKVPPALTLAFGSAHGDIAASFPEKEGWSKPVEASAAGMSGHRIRRVVTEDLIDMSETLVLLSAGDRGVRIRLRCLRMQEKLFAEAVEVALRTLEFEAPKKDYVNEHYGYALDLPKPRDEWDFSVSKLHDIEVAHHRVDVTDWALLKVIGADSEKEMAEVLLNFEFKKMQIVRYGGTSKEIEFCGEKATFADGDYLSDGIPCRLRILLVTHGKRLYLISYDQHEHGQKKTNHGWDTVFKSFCFTK